MASSSTPTTDAFEMSDAKSPVVSSDELLSEERKKGLPIVEDNDSDDYHSAISQSMSTAYDVRNMQRMGRKQQLVRHFRLLSTVSFVAIATANWELTIFTMNQALLDGGRAGVIWSFVWNFVGFLPIILSLAEMASMAPISGAQYHWVSEFGPSASQKQLSYFTGWMSTLAWQAGNAQGLFLNGTLIQTLILINNKDYSFPPWHATLIVVATTVLVSLCNIYGTRFLPYAQNILFALHVVLYMCLILPIWLLAPRAPADVVFTKFSNLGGWNSMPLAVLVGQLGGIAAMTGVDTAAHMSEEIKDAGRNVPKAMLGAFFINFGLCFPAVITVCFGIPDIEVALGDSSTYAVIYVLRQAMSKDWMTAFLSAVVVLLFFSNVSYLAAVSRDLFAFARDNGVPFSEWIAKVHPTHRVPVNALITSSAIAMILSLIYLGSPVAFYALTSLFVVAILQCYMFSIGSILWRRVRYPDTLPPSAFSLGKYGIMINTWALIYVAWAFFWAFWPQTQQVDASSLNWASVLFAGIVVVSGILYLFKARHVYTGPVVLVEGRKDSAGGVKPF